MYVYHPVIDRRGYPRILTCWAKGLEGETKERHLHALRLMEAAPSFDILFAHDWRKLLADDSVPENRIVGTWIKKFPPPSVDRTGPRHWKKVSEFIAGLYPLEEKKE